MDVKQIQLSWTDVEDLVEKTVASMLDAEWTPTCVVGLTRGGLVPATMISHFLGVPMCSLDVSMNSEGPFGGQTTTWLPEEIKNGHRFLIVDDINDTGATFAWVRMDWHRTVQFFEPSGENWPWEHIKFSALIHNRPSPESTDFFGMEINKELEPSWVVFPWERWFEAHI